MLEIVDVSNPASPVHKGSIINGTGGALLNGAFAIYVSGNYAYIASYDSNALEIVDIGTVTSTGVTVVLPTQITGTVDDVLVQEGERVRSARAGTARPRRRRPGSHDG